MLSGKGLQVVGRSDQGQKKRNVAHHQLIRILWGSNQIVSVRIGGGRVVLSTKETNGKDTNLVSTLTRAIHISHRSEAVGMINVDSFQINSMYIENFRHTYRINDSQVQIDVV